MARLLAVCALALSIIAISSPNAHAAIRKFAPDGGYCVGSRVIRCLELRYDDATERYRAWATISDPAGGSEVSVLVTKACIYSCHYSTQTNPLRHTLDSPYRFCGQGDWVDVPFYAEYKWWDLGSGYTGFEHRSGLAHFTCT